MFKPLDSDYTQPREQIPLDDLGPHQIRDALALLRAIRDGYAPATYIVGTTSSLPAVDLFHAGLIQIREFWIDNLLAFEVERIR